MIDLPTTDELTAQDAADGIEQQVAGAVIQDSERVLLLRRPVDDFRGAITVEPEEAHLTEHDEYA